MPRSAAPTRSTGRGAIGHGRVLMWRGGTVWVGRDAGAAGRHAHHAIQLTLAPLRPIRLRGGAADAWWSVQACIVMPDQSHEFDGLGEDVVMVFVEPESAAGRRLVARHGATPLAPLTDAALLADARQLLAGLHGRATDATLLAGAQAIVARLAGGTPVAAVVDPRIGRAMDWIRDHLDAPLMLAQVAAVAHLSPGRFRHLFVAQTGISFRAFVLWTRVNAAVVAAMAGASWTAAAQGAGFADSAHLTRTCRRMFGIAPTMLGRDDAPPPG